MDKGELLAFLGQDWTATQDLIREALASDIDLLNATNARILDNGGKQLRPILALLVARACGGTCRDSIRFAAASELLHNATLLHDDVADNSSTRRGIPTVMSLLGGRASVLVGDFWLVRAVEQVLSADNNSNQVIMLYSRTLSDLAEGEMLQLQKAAAGDTTMDDYIRIIFSKTASLFVAACVSAANSAGADDAMQAAIREYATNLGIAFQIKDDIMDYAGGNIGKPVGVDILEQKITLPLLGALEKVSEPEQQRVRAMVCEIVERPDNAAQIMKFVEEHDGIGAARDILQLYKDRAVSALAGIPQTRARDFLVQLADYTADRKV